MRWKRILKFRRSIACKISLLLLVTVLIPTIIVQMQLTARYEKNMEQYVQSYIVNAFEETFNSVERCFDEMKAQANVLFSASALKDTRQHAFNGYDRTLIEDHGKISLAFSELSRIFPGACTNYTYLLEDGRIFGTWGTLAFPADTQWLENLQKVVPSTAGYTWFDLNDSENENGMRPLGPAIAVAKQLCPSPFAAVIISLSHDAFRDLFIPLEDRAENMSLMLYDLNNQIMFQSNNGASQRMDELIGRAVSQSRSTTQVFRDGTRYVITRRLSANRWILVRTLDDPAWLLEGIGGGWPTLLMVGFFVCLTAIMLTVVFRTTNGIKRLDAAVRHFSKEQTPALLQVNGTDEVATLTRHFNSMQQHIQQLMRQALEDEKEKSRLHYEAQSAEISPHFLYNTLNSIKWTAIFSGAGNVADLIGDLGVLLEKHTSRYGESMTIEETMDTLDHYMNLQYARFGARVRLEKDIPPEANHMLIPKFSIQPLVENALLHGFEQQQRKGTVKVSVQLKQSYMLLLVEDDGRGISPQRLLEVENELADRGDPVKRRSIGLQNVHRRVRYLYGPEYGLKICSQEGVGTTMCLRLPIISQPVKEGEDVPGSHH